MVTNIKVIYNLLKEQKSLYSKYKSQKGNNLEPEQGTKLHGKIFLFAYY